MGLQESAILGRALQAHKFSVIFASFFKKKTLLSQY